MLKNVPIKHTVEIDKFVKSRKSELKYLDISDVNSPDANEFFKNTPFDQYINNKNGVDVCTHRFHGNVDFHNDRQFVGNRDYKHHAFLYVVGVSGGYNYRDSMERPVFFNNGKYDTIVKGEMWKFDATKDHALIWDGKIDMCVFWVKN